MDTHRRSLCKECKREWVEPTAYFMNSAPVSVTGNPKSLVNCPICGSPEVQLIEYKPDYPGLDIPREEPHRYKIIPFHTIGQAGDVDNRNPQITKVLGERNPKEFIVPPLVVEKPEVKEAKIEQSFPIKIEENNPYDLSDMD